MEEEWFKSDKEELKKIIPNLKLKGYLGMANECPECKCKGNFGSIIKYTCESDQTYLMCGWCGFVGKVF